MSTRVGVGGGVLLDPIEAAHLAFTAAAIRKAWVAAGRPVPTLVNDVLDDLATVARDYATSAKASDPLPEVDVPTSDAPISEWLTTTQVAALAEVTDRAVRYAVESGALVYRKRGDDKGTYLIEPASAADYAHHPRRSRRGTTQELDRPGRPGAVA